jgi:ribokinase
MLHDRYCDYLGRSSPHWAAASWAFIIIFSCTALLLPPAIASDAGASAKPSLIIIGSINVDIIVPVFRLPNLGETITARNPRSDQAVGGKGANQAIAAARMMGPLSKRPRFICRFGNDAYASMLEAALIAAGVDVSGSGRDESMPSGQGIVLLEADGTASSIVVGGSNVAWPENVSMHHIVHDAGAVLLQREVPEHVNIAAAKAAKKAGVTVLQDVGGEDRPISDDMLSYIDYLSLNESELERLTGSRSSSKEQTIDKAKRLIKRGARNVLVTLAERGSLLVATDGTVLRQAAYPVPGGKILDATAAGDAFRAGFAVALVEGRPLQQCLQFAAAAGAFAVSRMGAVPSLPTRDEVLSLLPKDIAAGFAHDIDTAAESHCSQGASSLKQRRDVIECGNGVDFPFKFASRLNSMQARRDLTNKAAESNDVLGWIARQSRVQGLDLVDFNYPQHFNGLTIQQLNKSLSAAGLQTGAV